MTYVIILLARDYNDRSKNEILRTFLVDGTVEWAFCFGTRCFLLWAWMVPASVPVSVPRCIMDSSSSWQFNYVLYTSSWKQFNSFLFDLSILVAFCARFVMYSSSSLPNPLGEEAWTAILADKTLLPSMLAYIPFTYQISCHVPKKQSSQHSLFSEGNQPKSNPKRFRRMGRDKRSKWKGGLYIPTTTSSFVLWSFVDPPQLRWIPRWNPE